ncbi:MAG: pyridoxamine 5'-phosphate oxidase family protein [Proteobacteria bacterium]|nr:pyridoxamine 5'-phosphate oxidase family protein [Pseudomonadota bacterium]
MADDTIATVRRLVRAAEKAALATAGGEGWPYASLVTLATDLDLSPILLLSGLADHSRNLGREPRLSLLIDGTAGFANPQAGPRATLMGRAGVSDDPLLRARFLARHPGARLYAGFGDFRIYRVTVERVHFVGGFARARWLNGRTLVHPGRAVAGLRAAEAALLADLNREYAEALALIAGRLLRRRGRSWRMTGLDPEGIDLAPRTGRRARLQFDRPVFTPEDVRTELGRLARVARKG